MPRAFFLFFYFIQWCWFQQNLVKHIETMSSSTTKTSSPPPSPPPSFEFITAVTRNFFVITGASAKLQQQLLETDAYNDLIRGNLKVERIDRGRVTCVVTVNPPISNLYGSLHGGAVGGIAKLMAVACLKTVSEKDWFLAELSVSYLSAAIQNVEVEVQGYVVRQGRNVAVISVEFRLKETKKLVYTARTTFYNVPIANL